MKKAIVETNIEGLPLVAKGKVRDIYDLGDELLIVTTDRVSAFDFILPTPVPGRGAVLTQMANFWFEKTKNIIPNHISDKSIKDVIADQALAEELCESTMIVKKAKPLPVEAIVRGYLVGSGWKEYQKDGSVCGIELPEGLAESSKLPNTLFTPSTKAEQGAHDENISFEKMKEIIGEELATKVKDVSIRIYEEAATYALERGIIIADTKFEFGILDGKLILIDEVLTPDSSRFWPKEGYEPGKSQPSFDKQIIRNWLLNSGWDKKSPPPPLPEEIVTKTINKYQEAYELLVGK